MMNKLQLLHSGLLGTIGAAVAFTMLSNAQLKTDLNSVSEQIVKAQHPITSTTTNSKPKKSLDQFDHNQFKKVVNSLADLTEQIDMIGLRLDDLDNAQQLMATDIAENNSSDYQSQDTMTETGSAYTPEQPRLSQVESQALLEYALTDPVVHDQIWSDNATIQIEQILTESTDFELADDFNITCGGQLCKIKSILPKDASFMEKEFFDMNLMADLAHLKSRSVLQQKILADGSIEFTHYIARQGYRLPTESPALAANTNGNNDLE